MEYIWSTEHTEKWESFLWETRWSSKKITSKFRTLEDAHKAVRYTYRSTTCEFTGDGDEYDDINSSLPIDIRPGKFALYVGIELSGFIVPMIYLKHPLFQALLENASEGYTFYHLMGLLVPRDSLFRTKNFC